MREKYLEVIRRASPNAENILQGTSLHRDNNHSEVQS